MRWIVSAAVGAAMMAGPAMADGLPMKSSSGGVVAPPEMSRPYYGRSNATVFPTKAFDRIECRFQSDEIRFEHGLFGFGDYVTRDANTVAAYEATTEIQGDRDQLHILVDEPDQWVRSYQLDFTDSQSHPRLEIKRFNLDGLHDDEILPGQGACSVEQVVEQDHESMPMSGLTPYERYRAEMIRSGWKPVPTAYDHIYKFPEVVCGNDLCTAGWETTLGRKVSITLWIADPVRNGFVVAPQYDTGHSTHQTDAR